MGFWFLGISIVLLADKLIPIVLISTVIGVMLKCKLDDLMENASKSSNCILKSTVAVCKYVEEIAYFLILLLTLPFSFIEATYLKQCCFGGDVSVRDDRKDVTGVTLEQLIDDINHSRDGYCFLRVLDKADRESFMGRLPDSYYTDIYKTKAIKLGAWLNMLKFLRLKESYVIYRRAYWGENQGRKEISARSTNYVVPMWYFDRHEERASKSTIEDLAAMFRRLFTQQPVIRILLRDNHMETFNLGEEYTLSSWENRNYDFPNERYGV